MSMIRYRQLKRREGRISCEKEKVGRWKREGILRVECSSRLLDACGIIDVTGNILRNLKSGNLLDKSPRQNFCEAVYSVCFIAVYSHYGIDAASTRMMSWKRRTMRKI